LRLAFMLINSEAGAEDELLKELRKLENVEEAYGAYGAYDIVVKVRANTEDVKEMSTWKIMGLKEYQSTPSVVGRDQV